VCLSPLEKTDRLGKGYEKSEFNRKSSLCSYNISFPLHLSKLIVFTGQQAMAREVKEERIKKGTFQHQWKATS